MNVNNKSLPLSISKIATSLKIDSGNDLSREQICANIIKQFTENILRYESSGFNFINEEFSKHSVLHFIGKLKSEEIINCEFVGLTDKGYLIVFSKEKQQHYTFYYSDLVKIYK